MYIYLIEISLKNLVSLYYKKYTQQQLQNKKYPYNNFFKQKMFRRLQKSLYVQNNFINATKMQKLPSQNTQVDFMVSAINYNYTKCIKQCLPSSLRWNFIQWKTTCIISLLIRSYFCIPPRSWLGIWLRASSSSSTK